MIFYAASLMQEVPSRLAIPFSPHKVFQIRRQARQPRCGNENGAIRQTPTTKSQRTKSINILTPRRT